MRMVLLALLYFVTGKIGLSFAVPAGYVSVIWPPSGIALGALLVYGRRLWPGIFLGSFALNYSLDPAWVDGGIAWSKVLLAASIAGGSTLQALVGHDLLRKFSGLPLKLRGVSDAIRLFAIAGPLACLVAASIGVCSLLVAGHLGGKDFLQTWLSWWVGDIFGVIVFLPLLLLLPAAAGVRHWRERSGRDLRAIGLALLALPLGLTFYTWKYLVNSSQALSQAHFEALTRESERAIGARLAAYVNAARSGAGVLQSSQFVSRAEWRTFAESLRMRDDYPGMLGLGWIEHVPAAEQAGFLARVHADQAPHFRIHPQARVEQGGRSIDVITYMEPEVANGSAIGLDLAADPLSREAVERAAATGLPTLSRAMPLAQDEESAPGFLLLQAVYRAGAPLDSVDARRGALRGYVYAPFLARTIVDDITPGEGRSFDISILEGRGEQAAPVLIDQDSQHKPRYELKREIAIHGQTWTLVWRSTPGFDQVERSNAGVFVLFGGLLFTGLLAVLLLALDGRRQDASQRGAFERPLVLPAATAVLIAGCSLGAYVLLTHTEDKRIESLVDEQSRQIEATLDGAVRTHMQSLRRMAHRWSSGGGTPYPVWRNDARDHIRQIAGLRELQWLGPDYHAHWAEGEWRVGWTGSRDMRAFPELMRELLQSAETGTPYVTEPREITPGETGFIIYTPLLREGRFDGFLAAVFSSRTFFAESVQATAGSGFAFKVKYGATTYFDNGEVPAGASWTREGAVSVDDRRWSFEVAPTAGFIQLSATRLPQFVLFGGLLIAALAGLLVRHVLVARLKAAMLVATEMARAECEARYELAMHGMGVGLWDWNISNNALYWSEQLREILGIRPEESIAHHNDFVSRVHPEDLSRVQAAINGHLRQRQPCDLEFRMRRGDDYIWVHVNGQAKFDAEGHAERMAGSMRDVTQQYLAQQALVGSEAQLRLLVENVPAAVAMFDGQMRYLVTSPRWLQEHGLEGRDVVGKSHYDVFPEVRGMPQWIDIHRRALCGERFDSREDSWIRANGQREWNRWATHPWYDSDGKVGGIVMFTEVITTRKLAESALRASEVMHRAAMDKAPIGKALVRPDGRFLRVNPAFCRMLGYIEKELLASDFQAITHPDDLVADLANLRELLDGRVVSYQMEKRYLHRDGRIIWAQLSVSLVRNDKGAVDFLVAQIQDVSERKVAERLKDELVSVVSQELGGPLGVIRESLDMISITGKHELQVQRLLQDSRAGCERLMTLVSHIHDLDQIAAGRMQFDMREESVAELVRMAVASGEAQAREHDVTLRIEDTDPEIMVFVDAGLLVQALGNLLSSAVRFSPAGGRVEVGVEQHGASVRMFVRDGGESARQEDGAGLGLHISRQLVERMRGRLGFISEAGAGSIYWVELPVVSRRGAMRAG